MAALNHHVDGATILSMHLTTCAAAAAAVVWPWSRMTNNTVHLSTALQACVWTLLAGPFGPVIAAAMLIPQRQRPALLAHPTRLETAPDAIHNSMLDRRLRIKDAHKSPALLDVFIKGTQPEKFNALRLITRCYEPNMATALQRAMIDGDGAVRVLAATVMAKQQNRFAQAIGALKDKAAIAPTSAAIWSDLGSAHFDHVLGGLLDPQRAGAELREAMNCLEQASKLDPSNPLIHERLASVRYHGIEHPMAMAGRNTKRSETTNAR